MTLLPAALTDRIAASAARHGARIAGELETYYPSVVLGARDDRPNYRAELEAIAGSEVACEEPSAITRAIGTVDGIDDNTIWQEWHRATVEAVLLELAITAGTDPDADEAEAGWHDPEPAGASQNATEDASESHTGQFIPAPLF